MVHQYFCRSHLVALDQQGVLPRLELQVIAQVQGGDDHAHIQSELPPDGADARQQIAALLLIYQRDEAVAHFQLQNIQGQQGLHFFRGVGNAGALGLGFGLAFGRSGVLGFLTLRAQAGHAEDERREDKKGNGGQARNQGKQQQHGGNQLEGPGVEGELGQKFFAHAGLGGRARNQQARARGSDDGRNGADKTIADGQQGIGGQGRVPVHIFLDHADGDAAHDVDQGDEHAGVDVAGDEFARAVHSAIEVGLLPHGGPAVGGFFLINKPGVEVGLNGHLLAGHGVQGKARRHFGDARGARGDDHLVENEQNKKDDRAHHIAAAHHKLAESADDLARRAGPHVAVEQNQPGGGHVERKPQQGGHQQQRRKDGELQRRSHEHGGDENEQRDGNAHAEHDIQKKRGQRHQHDKKNDDHAGGQGHFAVLGKAAVVYLRKGRCCHYSDTSLWGRRGCVRT